MQAFAALLDRLVLTPHRNGKLRLLVDYFRATPDPDRGYALAALTGDLSIPASSRRCCARWSSSGMDEVLFGYSYDYVGDLAETIALVWPGHAGARPTAPQLCREVVRGAAAPPRAAKGRGWSSAGSTGSTPPAAMR